MKYFYTAIILLFSTLNLTAQNKINPAGRSAIQRYHKLAAERLTTNSTEPAETPKISAIVSLTNGNDASWLINKGYDVTTDLGDIAVVKLPITEVETLAENNQVRSISFGNRRRLLMNKTRTETGAANAHAGIETNAGYRPFTGDGVVLGIMDGGIDPNHINFAGRVKRLWHFSTNDYTYNTTVTDYDESTISSFTTDDAEETHATHVAGIMAGGYRDNVTYADGSTTRTGANPYYGIAPDATLAFSVGDLYDENIIQGVENIIDYAESQGKPVAVNISLGGNAGPHDGTDDLSQALDRLGERGLISISAGNEAETNIAIEKELTSSNNTVKTMLYYNSRIIKSNYGALDIWASDGQTLTVTISNVSNTGTTSNATTISSATSAYGRSVTGCVKSGSVTVYAGVDSNNGRYNVYIEFDSALPKSGRFSIAVTGKAGQTVNMWFDGYSELTNNYYGTSTPLSGYTAGTNDGTINGMACGKNVLAVGAYTVTNSWTSTGGYSYSTDQSEVGGITTFSSFGHDFYGNQLPHIAAPGSILMSSFSTHYINGGYGDDYEESSADMVAYVKNGSKTNYWGPMEGTSMSCPVVTGVLGLWLQADPSLTIDRVKEILANTSTTDEFTKAHPERFGYGKISADNGLRSILEAASIGTVPTDDNATLIETLADEIRITSAGASQLSATLHDLQGRTVATANAESNTLSIPTSGLNAGIYIVKVASPSVNVSRKIAIR